MSIEPLGLGDRLKLLRQMIEAIRSLGLDRGELLSLIKEAIALFSDFSVEKMLAFIEHVLSAIESRPPGAAAVDWKAILDLLLKLLEILSQLS